MQTNIEKLAEELNAITAPYPNPLDCNRATISRRGGKHRIIMDHYLCGGFKFTIDFDKVLPFDPAGGKGKTNDVFVDAKISMSGPYGPPLHPTKTEVDRYCALYLKLVHVVLRKEALAGRISSKTLAEIEATRPRKDRINAASRAMLGSDSVKETANRKARREREERRGKKNAR